MPLTMPMAFVEFRFRKGAAERIDPPADRTPTEVGDVDAPGVQQQRVDLAFDHGVVDESFDGAFLLVDGLDDQDVSL